MRRRKSRIADHRRALGLLFGAFFGSFLGLLLGLPVLASAHPSGLPTKNAQAYTVATSALWLTWDLHPSIVIGILAITALYTFMLTRGKRALGVVEPFERGRAIAFYGCMVLLWFTLDGPLHHLSDQLLFTAHMVQHLVLQLVWAALFVWSVPGWMLSPLLKRAPVRKLAYRITRPVAAFFIYNGVTWFWHWPQMYDLALRVHEWHIVEHLMFMVTACIFWWPLIGSAKEVPRPAYGQQIFYVFFNMLAMKVLGIAISLQDDVIYTFYLSVPRVWGLTALGDQQIGGLLMWLPGGLLLWGGLGYVFIQIARKGTPARGTSGIPALDRKRAAAAAAASAAS